MVRQQTFLRSKHINAGVSRTMFVHAQCLTGLFNAHKGAYVKCL